MSKAKRISLTILGAVAVLGFAALFVADRIYTVGLNINLKAIVAATAGLALLAGLGIFMGYLTRRR